MKDQFQQQSNILETLIRRNTDELLAKLEIVRKSEIQAENARSEAEISGLITALAVGVGSASESRKGKVLGYGAAAVAGANTVAALSSAAELSRLAGSVFGTLLAQCSLSVPTLNQANELMDHLPEALRSSMGQAINRWRGVAADCYNLQLSRLTKALASLQRKVSRSEVFKASGDLDEGVQANYAELSALKTAAQMFGLNGHPSCAKIERFQSQLELTLQSEQARRDFKKVKTRRVMAIIVSIAVLISFFAAIVTLANPSPSYAENDHSNDVFGILFNLVLFSPFVFFFWKGLFKAQTQKKLVALTKELIEYLKNAEVSGDDIVLSRTKGDVEATYTRFIANAS